jgi:hypothetical protein
VKALLVAAVTLQLTPAQVEHAAGLIRGLGYPCATITRIAPVGAGPDWTFRVECGPQAAYLLAITPMGLALRALP